MYMVCYATFAFFIHFLICFIWVFFCEFFKMCSSELITRPSCRTGTTFVPVPACREDFSRLKLTSFDKLIEKTRSEIRNVRLCSEPAQKPGGFGNSGVAPDAA